MPKGESNAANIALEPQELWKTQKGTSLHRENIENILFSFSILLHLPRT